MSEPDVRRAVEALELERLRPYRRHPVELPADLEPVDLEPAPGGWSWLASDREDQLAWLEQTRAALAQLIGDLDRAIETAGGAQPG